MDPENNALSLSSVASNALSSISKGDLATAGAGFFDLVENSQLSQSGKLLKSGKLGEQGYIAGTIVEGIFESERLQQLNHGKMQEFLTTLATRIQTSQENFVNKIIDINNQRTQLLKDFLTSTEKQLKAAQEKMDEKLERVMAKYLGDKEPSDNEIKALDKLESMINTYFNTYSQMIRDAQKGANDLMKANAIDDQMVQNCVEANKIIMTSLFDTIRELGKPNRTSSQILAESLGNAISSGGDIIGKLLDKKNQSSAAKDEEEKKRSSPPKALEAPKYGGHFNNNNNNNDNVNAAAEYAKYADQVIKNINDIPANQKPAFVDKLKELFANSAGFAAIKDNIVERNSLLVSIKKGILGTVELESVADTLNSLNAIFDASCPKAPNAPLPPAAI